MRALTAAAFLVAALAVSGCLGNAVSEDEPLVEAADPTPTTPAPRPTSTPDPSPEVAADPNPGPLVTTHTFDGHFDCAATYLIVAGDCFAIVDGGSGDIPVRPGDTTEEAWAFPFRFNATWTRLDVTLTTAEETPLSDGWMLVVEPATWSGGHAPKFGRAQGDAPLSLSLVPGERHPTATTDTILQQGLGYHLVVRAYPVGLAPDAAGVGLLGAGAALDVDFTLTVDVVHTDAEGENGERDA